jgi:transcription termination factor NusB
MAQPQAARITCRECNSWYVSERELWDHVQKAHRRSVPEQSTFQHGDTQLDSFKDQLHTAKEEWAKLSAQLRNRVQARFDPEELDAIDRFILLASQASIFDDVRR